MFRGHKNWNHWAVAECFYDFKDWKNEAQYHIDRLPNRIAVIKRLLQVLPDETPTGAPMTKTNVRAAIRWWRPTIRSESE